MVETQSCVHVIYVLQKSKEVLHLLKCDALCNKEKWTNLLQILPAFLFGLLEHSKPTKNSQLLLRQELPLQNTIFGGP